jgi:hypothetical protein
LSSISFHGGSGKRALHYPNPMHTLEGTDSEYDKKAILAALHHLSRCLGPEPDRPPEVKQGMGKIGMVLRMDHRYSLQTLHGAKGSTLLQNCESPTVPYYETRPAHGTSGTKSPNVGLSGDSSVKKQRLGPVQLYIWQ